MYYEHKGWSIVYDKALRPDGSLFFPKRLNKEFLTEQRKTQGSYIFFNQYLNEIIPDGEQEFKKSWLKHYETLPQKAYTFAFIDPAISQNQGADYTALVVVDVDDDGMWYLKHAARKRITATQTIELFFKIKEVFNPVCIGVETVAYQEAIIHFLNLEMKRRKIMLPVKSIRRGPDKTKEMRIRGLIPRFEWGNIFVKQGLRDFEDEYIKFPKAPHDDIMDALASIEEIVIEYPKPKEQKHEPHPTEPGYESKIIQELAKRANEANGY